MSQYPAFAPSSQPPQGGQTHPAAGHRYPLSTHNAFPDINSLPPTKLHDLGGRDQPVYVGSAIFDSSIHPCKIAPHLNPPVRVPYAGEEREHHGRYDLLPIDDNLMEWVQTSYGRIPNGRRPVEGGYEENGERLFHALANVEGMWVPGKTGTHLGGANVAFGGERVVQSDYLILCWKF